MTIPVACPSCGRQYNVRDDAAGKQFKCKDCDALVEVPAADDEFGLDEFPESYETSAPGSAGGQMPLPARRRQSGSAGAGSVSVTDRTKLPAIFLMVICGFSILFWFWEIGMAVIELGNRNLQQGAGPPPGVDPQMFKLGETVGVVGVFAIFALLIVKDIFLIFAASRLMAGRSYGLAFAAALISVVPCLGSPCCLLGVPFGVWALVILNDPTVKAGFR